MISVARRLRDFEEAGCLNSLIGLWGFADDEVVLTKGGQVALVYRLRPVDYEGLDADERQALVGRYTNGLKLLDEHFRIYLYLTKRNIPPLVADACAVPAVDHAVQSRLTFLNSRRGELYDIATHCVLLYQSPTLRLLDASSKPWSGGPLGGIRSWLSQAECLSVIEGELAQAMAHLRETARAFEVQIEELRPVRLQRAAAFAFFKGLLNYDAVLTANAKLKHDEHLDFFLADSPVECHRSHLVVGHHHVRLLSMKEAPAQTHAFLLEALYRTPGELTACLEWQRIPSDVLRRDVQARRRHFHNKRVSLINYLSESTPAEDMLVDDSSAAMVRQLGDALTGLEVHGHFFGACSLTIAVHGLDEELVRQSSAECRRVLATHDGTLIEETYNCLNAWLAMLPGNDAQNVRRLRVPETTAADLAFSLRARSGDTDQ